MNTTTFDLVEIIKTMQRNRKMLLVVTLAAAVIGGIAYKLQKKKYKAKAEVYMTNPLFGDRINLYRYSSEGTHFVDYFGTEGDVDRALVMINSKSVKDSVISSMNLYKAYDMNPSKPGDQKSMDERYYSSMDIERTENCSIVISFTDTDAERAAAIVEAITRIADYKLRKYISDVKTNAYNTIKKKITEVDGQIAVLTDSLGRLRNEYQIYDIISPVRKNFVSVNVPGNNKPGMGMAIEIIQNIEAIKDQLVISRSGYSVAMNEFTTNMYDEVPLFHNVTSPVPPVKAAGLGTLLVVVACAFVAFFFTLLLLSFSSYLKSIQDK